MRIPNWRMKSKDFWVHSDKRKSVEVDWHNGIRSSGWKVVVAAYKPSGVFNRNISTSRLYSSIVAARKAAYNYMKSHPRG